MIAVLGVSGLIGSYLTAYLLANTDEPIVATFHTSPVTKDSFRAFYQKLRNFYPEHFPEDFENLESKLSLTSLDILDETDLEDFFVDFVEVYNATGYVNVSGYEKDKMKRINHIGTKNIVNAALKAKVSKFLHVSSVAVFKRNSNEKVNETIPAELPTFDSAYGSTKYMGEMEVWRGIAEGLPAVIINPVVVLGIGNYHNSSLKIFSTVKKGLRYYPVGSISTINALDVARLSLQLINNLDKSEGNRYILCQTNATYKNFIQQIANLIKAKVPAKPLHPSFNYWIGLAAKIYSLFTQKPPFITKKMADIAARTIHYDTQKINSLFPNFDYISLDQTLNDITLDFNTQKQ
jgi:nucleoside-diphosphate-sugar epimerase